MNYRYFIELQFKGKKFHGWQFQPDATTVQGELNDKLSLLVNRQIETVGAGRTDSGVHARYFVAHFDMDVKINNLSKLVHKLNNFLHKDICIIGIHPVSNDSHARFSALSRTYKYYISDRKDVFRRDAAWQLFSKLDLDTMNAGASEILKHSDFTSFSKLHTDVKTNTCKISTSYWKRKEHMLIYTITADRFLRNMVRSIVGTLIRMGKGKLSIDDFIEIIKSKDRSKAGESAPAQGLFLYDIEYPFPLDPKDV